MPTRQQLYDRWIAEFNNPWLRDEGRIGRGGFEAPNGRQWHEPEITPTPSLSSARRIGYFLTNFETGENRFILDDMLEAFTEGDDQDWHDFNRLNIKNP